MVTECMACGLNSEALDPTECAYCYENSIIRICDTCGTWDMAYNMPDWINGSCEECDPDIWKPLPKPPLWYKGKTPPKIWYEAKAGPMPLTSPEW